MLLEIATLLQITLEIQKAHIPVQNVRPHTFPLSHMIDVLYLSQNQNITVRFAIILDMIVKVNLVEIVDKELINVSLVV